DAMTEQSAAGAPEVQGAAVLPDVLDDVLGALGPASVDGLSEADLMQVITTREATKGAAAALQARHGAVRRGPGRAHAGDCRAGGDLAARGLVPAQRDSCRGGAVPPVLAVAGRPSCGCGQG